MHQVVAKPAELDDLGKLVADAKKLFQQAAGQPLNAQEEAAFERARDFLKENRGIITDARDLFVFVDSNLDNGLFFSTEALVPDSNNNHADLVDWGGKATNAGRASAWAEYQWSGRIQDATRDDLSEFLLPHDPDARAAVEHQGVHVVKKPLGMTFLENRSLRRH